MTLNYNNSSESFLDEVLKRKIEWGLTGKDLLPTSAEWRRQLDLDGERDTKLYNDYLKNLQEKEDD